jgi:glutamine synthetase
MFKTLDEVKNYCTSNHIQIIDFKMIDIWGRWRHLSSPGKPSVKFSKDWYIHT